MSATLASSRQSTPARGARELTPAQQKAQDSIRERIRRQRSATPVDPNAPKHPRAQGRVGTPGTNRGISLTPGPQARLPKPAAPKRAVCTNVECDMHDQINNPSIVKEDNGNVICGACGVLISESHIAADATFQEGSNGQALMQGTMIGAGQDRGHTEAGVNQILGTSDSGMTTRTNAKAEIRGLATRLGIPGGALTQLIERSWRIWTVVYNMGRTKGRERKHVCAVCLYMGTRTLKRGDENNRFLLIDFADLCDVSVFYLGRIYQDFVKLPGFREEAGAVHAVNAENLIHRYVSDLDVPGELKQRVSNEAVCIFKRMDRDWMTTGRKPSGLCGAAVLLAFRMNNLRRTVREVVYTAKVCEVTINQRLQEFSNTAAGKLTVSEYRTKVIDVNADMNHENYGEPEDHGVAICAPPAFYKQSMPKKVRKRKLPQISESTTSDADDADAMIIDPALEAEPSTSQATETPEAEEQSSKRRKTGKKANAKQTAAARKKAKEDKESMPPPPPPIDPLLLETVNQELENMTTSDAQSASKSPSNTLETSTNADPAAENGASPGDQHARESSPKQKKVVTIAEPSEAEDADYRNLENDIEQLIADPAHVAVAEAAHQDVIDNPRPDAPDKRAHEQEGNTWRRKPAEPVVDEDDGFDYPDVGNHPDLQPIQVQGPDGEWQTKVYWPTSASVAAKVSDSEIIAEDEFEGDPEVEDCFLDEEERMVKSAHWLSKYGPYLRFQHLKKIGRLLDEANGVVKTRSKRTKAPLGDVSGYEKYADGTVARNMGEVYQKLWANRAPKSINSKINWDVLREVFNEDDGKPDGSESPSKHGSPSPGSENGTPRSKNTPIFSRGDLLLKKAPRQKAPSTRAGREAATAANKIKKAAKKAEKEKEKALRDETQRANMAVRAKRLEELRKEAGFPDYNPDEADNVEAANNNVIEETVVEDDDLQNMDPDQMTEEQKAEAERMRRLQMGEHDDDDFGGLDDGMDSDDGMADDDEENNDGDDWDGEEV